MCSKFKNLGTSTTQPYRLPIFIPRLFVQYNLSNLSGQIEKNCPSILEEPGALEENTNQTIKAVSLRAGLVLVELLNVARLVLLAKERLVALNLSYQFICLKPGEILGF